VDYIQSENGLLDQSLPCRDYSRLVCEVLVCDMIQELAERGAIFGEHPDELDAVAELRIAGDNICCNEKRVGGVEFEFEAGARRKGIHALDVASVEA